MSDENEVVDSSVKDLMDNIGPILEIGGAQITEKPSEQPTSEPKVEQPQSREDEGGDSASGEETEPGTKETPTEDAKNEKVTEEEGESDGGDLTFDLNSFMEDALSFQEKGGDAFVPKDTSADSGGDGKSSTPSTDPVPFAGDVNIEMTQDLFDKALGSPEAFGEVVQGLVKQGMAGVMQQMYTDMAPGITNLINETTINSMKFMDLSNKNPIVAKYPKYYATQLAKAQSENPDMDQVAQSNVAIAKLKQYDKIVRRQRGGNPPVEDATDNKPPANISVNTSSVRSKGGSKGSEAKNPIQVNQELIGKDRNWSKFSNALISGS